MTRHALPDPAEHEALIQFLYLAPVGLVQADADGAITLSNPISAQLLMPLSRDGGLDNLFTALEDVAPDLRAMCARFGAPHGMVCDGLHIHVPAAGRRTEPAILSLSLVKLDAGRLMAVLQDVTEQVRRERALRQSDAWLNALLSTIRDYALVSLDPHGRIDRWNDSIGRVTGHTDAVVGRPFSVFELHGGDVRDRLQDADRNGWSLDERTRVRADGTPFPSCAMISPLPGREPGAPDTEPAYCMVLRDMTDVAPRGHDDRQAYEALMQFLYRTPIGLLQAGSDGAVEMLNPMAAQLLMPLAPGGTLDNLFEIFATVAPGLPDDAARSDPSGVVLEGLRIEAPDGRGGQQVLSLSVMKLDAQRLMAAVTDITLEARREQERLASRLSSAARIDPLTRMPNRAAVQDELRTMLGREQRDLGFAVLFMNCDRFRQVNDTLGQAIGDELLVLVAERIRNVLRPPSDRIVSDARGGQIAARVGGDEFVVVLDGLRRVEDAESVAARLIAAIGRGYHLQGHDVVCNVSVGVAWGEGQEPDALLRDAGIAMVEAKRAGGARHVRFEAAMRERAARRGDIEAELRQALQHDQLFVVYQPVVALGEDGSTDHAAGVEALVRWQHPVRGVVPPFEFIGVAEECGLIGALGDFVLERACRDFMQWRAALGDGAPRLLAVNLSRAQLAQPGWAGTVARILADTGMHARQLQLEVTESLAAQDTDVQARMHELKALGITLALDDFGTGYSSLSSLHLLPVDTVKIDRSFVSQSETSQHHRVLIEATVKVAQSLGMNTVAEGIETREQASVVRTLQCDKGQGYLYSRPLTSAALLDWLGAVRAG